MTFKTDSDTKFDSIHELSWYPWFTKSYKGTLILGESHYSGEDFKDMLFSKDFTRNRILGPAMKGSGKSLLFRNLERAVFAKVDISSEERIDFWDSVAFMNLVQRTMADIKERPSRDDYKTGWNVFARVAEILKPHTVIAIGTEINKVQTFRQWFSSTGYEVKGKEIWSDEKNGRGYEYCFPFLGDRIQKVIFIKHTSAYFSWETCSRFLHGNCKIAQTD